MTFASVALPLARPARSLGRLLARLTDLHELSRQRHSLGQLAPHMLRDIGLTPDQARAEAARPAWDAPAHWRD